MKKRVTGILIAVALLTIAAAGIGPASAYFTDRDEGSQSHAVQLGDSTTVTEEADWNKKVMITNDAASTEAIWVRSQAFAALDIQKQLKYSGSGWTQGDNGWWYYSKPVDPGKTADTLNIQLPDKDNPVIPEAKENKTFNVIVVYETTPDTGTAETAQQAFAEAETVQSSQTGGK